MKESKQERLSNFELLRITSMLFIIMWHVIQHNNALFNTSNTLNFIISFIFVFISIHVNSFILVTGYFQYNKKTKYKKIVNLIGQVLFYNVFYIIISFIINPGEVTLLEVLESTSLLNIKNYWFINYYIVLYLLTPFLNKYIENSNKKEHKNTLIIMFICFCVIPFITKQRTINNNGLTIISFIFLYLVGAFFGKYPIKDSLLFQKMSKNKRQLLFLFLFITFGVLNFINYRFGLSIEKNDNEIIRAIGQTITSGVIGFSNPLLVIQTIFYLLFFETLEIKSKLINWVSSLTFGMYLVHENSVLYNYFYRKAFPVFDATTTVSILPKMFVAALFLFFASLIIEAIRKLITKLLCKTKIIKKISNKFYTYIEEF